MCAFCRKSSNEKTNYKKCQKWLSLCRQGKCFPVSQLFKNILKSKLFSSSVQSVRWCHVLFWTWKYVKNTYQLFIYARGKLTTQNFYLFCTCSHFSINTEDEFLQRWSFIWMLLFTWKAQYKNDQHLLNFFLYIKTQILHEVFIDPYLYNVQVNQYWLLEKDIHISIAISIAEVQGIIC